VIDHQGYYQLPPLVGGRRNLGDSEPGSEDLLSLPTQSIPGTLVLVLQTAPLWRLPVRAPAALTL
jgi:hypothetical protein